MAIARARFERALREIEAPDWVHFERLASAFLASEFPNLRTVAAASGDGGRDSELFGTGDEPAVIIQYSVTGEWEKKIRDTFKRTNTTCPSAHTLIYMTNKAIGAAADTLKAEFRKAGKFLDTRDCSWFLDRANTDSNREAAAESVALRFVDPLLRSREFDKNLIIGIEGDDAKTALLFLEMQTIDEKRAHGLTKSSYETLTLAALRDTDTSSRLTRSEIYAKVRAFLPTHPEHTVHARVDAALKRLAKSAVRHRSDDDKFHLRDEERKRVVDAAARIDALRRGFENDVLDALAHVSRITVTDQSAFLKFTRNCVEAYFLRKGEEFANAAVTAEGPNFDEITLKSVIQNYVSPTVGVTGRNTVEVTLQVLQTVLQVPDQGTSEYLSILLNSYTLFAFLAATPDVQRVTQKMFSGGEIWLDTSVILPMFGEVAAPPSQRPFTEIFKQAKAAQLRLYVTSGVIEELETHINMSRHFARSPTWRGTTPYLFASFAAYGGKRADFPGWVEQFAGENDSFQDVADYLRRNQIHVETAADHENVSAELAMAVRSAWQAIHELRRADTEGHQLQTLRLAEHDSETYLHVISSRIAQRGRAPLGYSMWWFTLDSAARKIMAQIDWSLRPNAKTGPVMSIDYLIRYLAFGPARDKVDLTGAGLSKVYAGVLAEQIPPELLKIFEQVRSENATLPEHIIQRRIRERLNEERSRLGNVEGAGMMGASEAMQEIY